MKLIDIDKFLEETRCNMDDVCIEKKIIDIDELLDK